MAENEISLTVDVTTEETVVYRDATTGTSRSRRRLIRSPFGVEIPERESDCTGERPSWYPFQIQVDECDLAGDDPAPAALTDRERALPDPVEPAPWDPTNT